MAAQKNTDLRVYFSYAWIGFKGQLQYRGAIAVSIAFMFVQVLLDPTDLFVLFDRFGSAGGWPPARVFAMVGMALAAYGIAELFARGLDYFPHFVKNGDLDRFLVRPRGVLMQAMAARFHLNRFPRVISGLGIAVFSLRALGLPSPAGWLMLLAALFAGVLLTLGLFVLISALSILLVGSMDPFYMLTHVFVTQSAKSPPHALPRGLTNALTYGVPVLLFVHIPLECLYGAAYPAHTGWLALPACGAFLAACLLCFSGALRKYTSTGS